MKNLILEFKNGQVLTSENMNTIVLAINELINQVNVNTEAIQNLQPSEEQN